jgi:hypothetical protein
MQICHVLNKEYVPERFDTLAVTMLWLMSIAVRVISGNPSHYLGCVAMLISIGDCMRFIFVLARRMANLLHINVLTYTDKAKRN